MPRAPDERFEKAKALYLSGMKLIEIASQLGLPEGTVRRWKCTHKWDSERSDKKTNARNKGGAPIGNHNASGPPQNNNAVKHGLFQKYLPQETLDIVNQMSKSPIDLLWDNIQIAYAAIVRAQQISYVRDRDDITITQIARSDGDTPSSEKWEVQQAWDKQANFMKAQARAQSELRSLIRQYDEMINAHPELATEEQKARIAALKAKSQTNEGSAEDDGFIKALEGEAESIWKDE